MSKSPKIPAVSGSPTSRPTPRSWRRAATGFAGLEFEKCEPRNLLSVSSGVDLGGWLESGQQQAVLGQLATQPETAYLQQGISDLQLVHVEDNATHTVVVFQQWMEGLPVHGAYVSVVQGGKGEIQNVLDGGSWHLATEDSLVPALSLETALDIANQEFFRADPVSEGQLTWFRFGDRFELAWEVQTVVANANVNHSDLEFVTVIDANQGNLLSQVQSPTTIEDLADQAEIGVYPRIVINNTIGAAGSRAYAAPFDAVVELPGCTGTLVAENLVISARHCGVGAGSQVRFGDNGNAPVFTATVQSSQLPDGNGSLLDGGDVSILTLTSNVPSNIATPMRFVDATNGLVGSIGALLGYGLNGLGSTGHQGSSDGFRWGGENVIDRYGSPASSNGSNIFSTDFDNGTGAANTIPTSSATPVPLEATTAPGDSGGPLLVQQGGQWLVAGVLSGGTTSNSVYGDISWWTGTAPYRAEIEAAGGVFAGAGTVNFDQSAYQIGDTVGITVIDDNGINPVTVTIVSDSGDTETLTLSAAGGGTYTGSIVTSDAGVASEDGTLQVSDMDQLMVTYVDPDDGTGNPANSTATATIFEPSNGVLVGVDFSGADPSPTNWTAVGGGTNTTFNNLGDENGGPTVYDLAIAELANGGWNDFAVTPSANTIPQNLNSLTNIDGQIFTGGDPIRLTYQDLNPLANYEVYVMAAEGFFTSIQQRVTITGDGSPIVFDQAFASDQLFVNDQLGDSNRFLSEYAQLVTSNANGEIVIDVTPLGGTPDVVLAGVAILEVPVLDLIDPFGAKFLDGVAVGGSLVDAQFSDDVYFQLAPSPTTNPNKQIIDLILLAEYSGPLNSFEFYLEAAMLGGPEGDVIQTIELWNDTDNVWELFDSRVASNTDVSISVSATGDLTRFLQPLTGEMIAKVQWVSPEFAGSPFSWTVDVDQFGWLIS